MGSDKMPGCVISAHPEDAKAETPSQFGSRREAVNKMLDILEINVITKKMDGTIADYLRLFQVAKEMGDERPREIEIRWVNSIRGEPSA